jgi:Peptidase A4 family
MRVRRRRLDRNAIPSRGGPGDRAPTPRLLTILGLGILVAAATSLPTPLASAAGSTPPGSLRAPMIATSPVTPNPVHLAKPPHKGKTSGGSQTSLDWAGYAVTGATFTTVSGSWKQPAATCPGNRVEQAAFWVGTDGYSGSDPTVQQVGTDSDCTKGKGKVKGGPSYYAWYQMFPASDVVLSSSLYPVAPGDAISASVSRSGSDYVLHVADGTKWTFTTTQAPSTTPQNSSAEWIAEAPSSCSKSCKVLPLADFGSIGFSSASANGEAISAPAFTNFQINMSEKNPKKLKAQTSALTGGGSGFTVSWLHN